MYDLPVAYYSTFDHVKPNQVIQDIHVRYDDDQDNYILFIGCSHTMGVGLELEKTYPHILSEKLKMDYYNLAVPATLVTSSTLVMTGLEIVSFTVNTIVVVGQLIVCPGAHTGTV